MSMFFTRDAWDDARDERIAQIGLEAYNAEVKEAQRLYDLEFPDFYMTTDPIVHRHDVIATWHEEGDGPLKTKVFEKEFHIKKITEDGNIWGTLITNNPMRYDPTFGAMHVWSYGPYKRLSSVIGEYDTTDYGLLK